jgi:hypothetical protein
MLCADAGSQQRNIVVENFKRLGPYHEERLMMQERCDLIDFMVSIMRCKRANNVIVEVAANVIAADARLCARILQAKTQSELGDRIFDILQRGDNILSECNEIASQFNKGLNSEIVCERLYEVIKKIDDIIA